MGVKLKQHGDDMSCEPAESAVLCPFGCFAVISGQWSTRCERMSSVGYFMFLGDVHCVVIADKSPVHCVFYVSHIMMNIYGCNDLLRICIHVPRLGLPETWWRHTRGHNILCGNI